MSPRLRSPASLLSAAAATLACVVAAACSSSSEQTTKPDPAGSCSAIASACHPYDKVTTLGHECHELGHDGADPACAERRDECLAACPPVASDSGAPSDAAADAAAGDAADAADAAPDPACTSLCDCLGTTCATAASYPFADRAACLSACAAFGPTEKECYPKWCAKAAASATPRHECEHAWGKLGTVECDTL